MFNTDYQEHIGCAGLARKKCLDKGFVVWLTGLPGSGKTTIATKVKEVLENRGYRVELLDGDWARKTISLGAGFTREERKIHLHRVAWVARLLARNGVIVLASFVSPYRDVRATVRRIIEEEAPFIEVYVKASIDTVMKRDPKGLYARALRGEIKHMTGVDDPYEPPLNPDLTLVTDSKPVEENVRELLDHIKARFNLDI